MTKAALQPIDRMLRLPDLKVRVGLGKSAIYDQISLGKFPAPVKLGRASGWPESTINQFLKEKATQ